MQSEGSPLPRDPDGASSAPSSGHLDASDAGDTSPVLVVPPEPLRYRVHGWTDVGSFLAVGERCRADLEAALRGIGRPLEGFRHVLDFGCGPGRTLLAFARKRPPDTQFFATDIDAEALEWCRDNLPFVTCTVNDPLPPLPYADETIDLIYSISVFTHLGEDHQFQ